MKLAFPDVKDFGELFPVGPYAGPSKIVAEWPSAGEPKSKIKVRGYCSIYIAKMVSVKPSELVLEYLKSTFVIPGEVSFRAAPRGSDVLVTVRYESILAERWLALVDPATVPGL